MWWGACCFCFQSGCALLLFPHNSCGVKPICPVQLYLCYSSASQKRQPKKKKRKEKSNQSRPQMHTFEMHITSYCFKCFSPFVFVMNILKLKKTKLKITSCVFESHFEAWVGFFILHLVYDVILCRCGILLNV